MMDANVWVFNEALDKRLFFQVCLMKDSGQLSLNSAKSFKQMGDILIQDRAFNEAADYYRKAIRAGPSWIEPYCALGNLLLRQQFAPEAEQVFRTALTIQPRHMEALMGLGTALKFQMRAEEALSCFENAITVAPHHQDAWLQKAAALEMANRALDAHNVIREARAKFPDWKLSVLELKLARRSGDIDGALDMMKSKIGNISTENLNNFQVFFEMGFLYDAKGDPEQAFEYFTKGNHCLSLSDAARRFDDKTFPDLIDNSINTLSPEWLKTWIPASASNTRPSPVFIVGFPRSGTTLLDRVLGSHPDISVVEEPPAIFEATKTAEKISGIAYPSCLASLDTAQIDFLREKYFKMLSVHGADLTKLVVIDKNPLNMVRMDMIYRLFPEAKIIMILRHPCDCVLSCFMQPFGMNMATYMFLSLKSAAELYDKTFSAWEVFCAVLPLQIHTLRYEDLVTDFRETVNSVLDHIGVQWSDEMMEFHKKATDQGTIRTASYSQVTEKLYSNAQNRWHRYQEQMRPVLDTLLPWAERHGY